MTDQRTTLPIEYGAVKRTLQISVPSTFMRRAPDRQAACDTEVLFGEIFDVYREESGWAWGQLRPFFVSKGRSREAQTLVPGYIGWIQKQSLVPMGPPPSHRVTALQAPVFSKADIKSPVQTRVFLNTHLALTQVTDDFFALSPSTGFLHRAHLSSVAQDPKDDFVATVERHLGLPYVWGGISTIGLDCSGLVRSSLRASGRDAPRDADQQEAALGTKLPLDLEGLKRGDLVFWKGHVGLMRDPVTLLHANAFHMRVEAEPILSAVKRIEPSSGTITALKRL